MGDIFKHASKYVNDDSNDFVEIGSDRYEGSTEFLSDLAKKQQRRFHSVDIDRDAEHRLKHKLTNVDFYICKGSEWCTEIYPSIGNPIGLLYLDNFDYNWNIFDKHNEMIKQQEIDYKNKYGLDMSNENCQVEHMRQILALYPYLAERCTVICDDTYKSNGCWIGKCGGVVLFLLSKGFKTIIDPDIDPKSYGVILCR